MKVDIQMVDGVAIITLAGELDSRGHHLLDKAIKDLISQDCFSVVLDLSTIRFLGNQTVSLLLSHLKDLRANHGDIKFLNPHRMLLQHLKKNRIAELFKIYSTQADAVKSFSKNATSEPAAASVSPDARPPERTSESLPVESESVRTESSQTKSAQARFDSGAILFANSCMLAAVVKILESKKLITSEEASDLLDYERLSLKGVSE